MTTPAAPPPSPAAGAPGEGPAGARASGGTEITGGGPESTPRWRGVTIALVLFVLAPVMPQVRAFLPITETIVLIVPAIAACTLVGWLRGGRFWLALIWCLLAAWTLRTVFLGAPDGYGDLVRGWSLLAAGALAIVSIVAKDLRFLPRALLALLLSFAASVAVNTPRPDGVARIGEIVAERIHERNAVSVELVRQMFATTTGRWRDFLASQSSPELTGAALDKISTVAIPLFPAILALETLAALALAYALYRRISRIRIGEPLRSLREFRFNDQLIWGLVAGLTIAVLPTFATLSGTGRNLLAFFGALYGLRALGVLQWLWGRAAGTLWVVILLLVLPAVGAIARTVLLSLLLSVGVSDSWLDWRRRFAK